MVQILLSITRVAPCPGEAKRKRGYKVDANDILVKVHKYYAMQWRGPDLSQVTKLSWMQD